jgi:hypothetical protein
VKILAHRAESMEEFCGLLQGNLKDWKMQLHKEDAGLLRLLRETCQAASEATVTPLTKLTRNTQHVRLPSWGFLAYDA